MYILILIQVSDSIIYLDAYINFFLLDFSFYRQMHIYRLIVHINPCLLVPYDYCTKGSTAINMNIEVSSSAPSPLLFNKGKGDVLTTFDPSNYYCV